ncbi:MAG: DUF1957 domain-containing protein, partial [bacterium]|nr:DUF1957 domain-containing protein [bacterium]
NGTNDWIYRHLHKAAERMVEVSNKYKNEKDTLKIRILNQMARELLLAQSSDWAFIMTTGTMVQYAVNRTKEHILNFIEMYEWLKNGNVDLTKLDFLENKNSIFKDIDYRVFAEEV